MMAQELARIRPVGVPAKPRLSGKQKAAIVVRLLLADGSAPSLIGLPEDMQADLTEQMAAMRLVDRTTVEAVAQEFLDHLEAVGLSFPGGIDRALTLLDGHISAAAASRLRRTASLTGRGDPWERIVPLPSERLLPIMQSESVEVCAVILSKLPVTKSADLLAGMQGERARRVAHAVSRTGNVDPDTVARIGQSIALQLDAEPPKAFATVPEARIGAILNVADSETRDALLAGLESDDAVFAERVRKTIFTFDHIPARIAPLDIPRALRAVEQPVLVTALAGAGERHQAVVAHILDNLPQRMATTLREEIEARSTPRRKEAEAAQSAVIEGFRRLEAEGSLTFVIAEEE